MALLHEAVNYKKYDVRLTERSLARGLLTPSEVEAASQALPDDAENADWVSIAELSDEPAESDSRV
jgi:hypothetical protein